MKNMISIFFLFTIALLAQPTTHSDTIEMVENWNHANNTKDPHMLSKLYAPTLIYYGSKLSRAQCIRDKKRFFRKYPSFSQDIVNVHTEAITPRLYRVSFGKYVKLTPGSSEKYYPSYLLIDLSASTAKIIEEGDKVTDANLAKRKRKQSHRTSYTFNGDYTIRGEIITVPYYGPPGYGEDPANDTKLTAYVLRLESPITVISNDDGDTLNETTTASEVQLVIHDFEKFKNLTRNHHRITLRGVFFSAHTGYHIRDLLMDVKSIEP